MEVVTVGLKGSQEQFDNRSQWVDPTPQVIAPAGADAEQPAEVEQMYREIQHNTQNSRSGTHNMQVTMVHNQVRVRQTPLQEAAGSKGHHHKQ